MSVKVKLLTGETEEWIDGEEESEMRTYSYELHPSGAVLVHRRREAIDGLVVSKVLEEKVIGAFGPSAWEKAAGTMLKS